MITPPIAAAWSTALLVGLATATSGAQRLVLCCVAVLAAAIATRSPAILLRGAWLTGPVIAILLGVHGFVSPLFPVSDSLWGLVPFRADGFAYALDLAQMIFVVTFAALLWLGVSRRDFVEDLIWLGTPPIGVAIAGQTLATLGVLSRKISAVFLAQKARGVPVEGRVLGRLRALPSVLVPVVAVTLVEADARSQIMTSRGLGTGRIANASPRRFRLVEGAVALSLPTILCLLLIGAP